MLKLFSAVIALLLALFLGSCGGGSSASPPSSLTVTAGDTSVVVNFTATSGVTYWLFYAPGSTINCTDAGSITGYTIVPGITVPYTLPSLSNGTAYSFGINARTNGGPGGACTTLTSVTPRLAGTKTTSNTVPWVASTAVSANSLNGETYGSTFVAVGANGLIYNSSNAVSYTSVTSPITTNLNGVAFFNSQYTAVGDSGKILTSTDATTWTAQTSGTTNKLNAIAGNSSLYVAVGASGTLLTSTDGTTWTKLTGLATTNNLNSIIYSTQFIAVGDTGTVITSTDGVTWTLQTAVTAANLKTITVGSYIYSALGAAGANILAK